MAEQRIYIIEDDADILELVSFHLQREGYMVKSFATGESGLKAIEAQTPDLLVLDLMLPGVGGLEICRKLRASDTTAQLPRRQAQPEMSGEAVVTSRALTIHPGRREVLVDGVSVDLTFSEFEILRLLVRRAGWVFTRKQIFDAVRGEDYAVTERAVDVQIVGLRKKMGDYGACIETVRGVGYRFKE